MKKILFFLFISCSVVGQEFNATVNINYAQINTSVDRAVFENLKKNIINFFNQSWTNQSFAVEERIDCNILLVVNSVSPDNIFNCKLSIVASRPVWNTDYSTTLLSFEDPNVTFSYTNYQYFNFNETQINNAEPLVSNLPAILAYYIYVMLGLNFDSFGLRGGWEMYQKALNIVNNAPRSGSILGWSASENGKNRYWFITELTDPRTDMIHDAYYLYFRKVLDNLYENKNEAKKNLQLSFSKMNEVDNRYNGNSMTLYLFFLSHAFEIGNIIADIDDKNYQSLMLKYLAKLNPSNYGFYKSKFGL